HRRGPQDAVGRFLPQSFQQGADGVLGRGVDCLGRDDLQPGGGHRGHHVAAALPPEDRQRGGDAVEHAPEVDVDHRLPAVDVEVGDGPDLADAGVADQYVEPAELLDRRVGQALEVLAPGDVGGAADGTPAVVADLLRELVQALGPARAQHDGGAPPGEQPRGGLADAAARAGDGDDLAADAGHRVSLPVKWTCVHLVRDYRTRVRLASRLIQSPGRRTMNPTRLRADAAGNHARIIAAARAAIADAGEVKLNAIARQAGVGQGTLYRHFPTRE